MYTKMTLANQRKYAHIKPATVVMAKKIKTNEDTACDDPDGGNDGQFGPWHSVVSVGGQEIDTLTQSEWADIK